MRRRRSSATGPQPRRAAIDRAARGRQRLQGGQAGAGQGRARQPPVRRRRRQGAVERLCKGRKLYGATDLTLLLNDKEATRQAVLDALDDLAKKANPDDLCILFLSGHGDYREEKHANGPPKSVFVFCPPDYDPTKPYDTGITNEVLFEKMAAIPCQKLLILDACHSGGAVAGDSPAHGFAPDGQGPIIMAGCDVDQSSLEHPLFGHGLFTKAILDALQDVKQYPDHKGVRELFVTDLFRDTRNEMPKLLRLIDERAGRPGADPVLARRRGFRGGAGRRQSERGCVSAPRFAETTYTDAIRSITMRDATTWANRAAVPAVLALALAAAGARADDAVSIDRALKKQAPAIKKDLLDHGYRTVGVLKFLAASSAGKPRDDLGALNRTLADRLEVALVLSLDADDEDKLSVLTHASDAVAKSGNKGLDHLTRGRGRPRRLLRRRRRPPSAAPGSCPSSPNRPRPTPS